jgi:threonine dehydrogenase-like Zn-dependent dehydrogenase
VRAVRSTDVGIEVVEIDPPDAGDGVRVTIRSASICGTDLNMVQMGALPVTLGHELAGVTDDGTPVAIEPIAPCGACDQCQSGDYHRCRSGPSVFIGTGCDGGMADEIRVPEQALVPLADGLGVGDACLVEPMAVVLHGLRLAGIAAGDRVGVVGAGGLGLCAAAAAKALGAEVGVVGRHEHQLAAAEALGVGPAEGEYDITVEAAGSESAMAEATRLAGPGATLVALGVHGGLLPVPGIPALLKELRIVPSITYNRYDGGRDVDDAAAILAADPAIAATLITHRLPLDAAAEAFRLAADRTGGAIKVVLEP